MLGLYHQLFQPCTWLHCPFYHLSLSPANDGQGRVFSALFLQTFSQWYMQNLPEDANPFTEIFSPRKSEKQESKIMVPEARSGPFLGLAAFTAYSQSYAWEEACVSFYSKDWWPFFWRTRLSLYWKSFADSQAVSYSPSTALLFHSPRFAQPCLCPFWLALQVEKRQGFTLSLTSVLDNPRCCKIKIN